MQPDFGRSKGTGWPAMSEILSNPAFWLLAILPAFGLVRLSAAVYLRPYREKLRHLVDEMSRGALSKEDRGWLRAALEQSRGRHLVIAAPFAPVMILAAVVFGVFEGWRDSQKSRDDRVDAAEAEVLRLRLARLDDLAGMSLAKSRFASDPRGLRLTELVSKIEEWSSPISMLWIVVWLIVAAPLLVVSYAISGSIRPIITNVWAPLREPIESLIAAATRPFGMLSLFR